MCVRLPLLLSRPCFDAGRSQGLEKRACNCRFSENGPKKALPPHKRGNDVATSKELAPSLLGSPPPQSAAAARVVSRSPAVKTWAPQPGGGEAKANPAPKPTAVFFAPQKKKTAKKYKLSVPGRNMHTRYDPGRPTPGRMPRPVVPWGFKTAEDQAFQAERCRFVWSVNEDACVSVDHERTVIYCWAKYFAEMTDLRILRISCFFRRGDCKKLPSPEVGRKAGVFLSSDTSPRVLLGDVSGRGIEPLSSPLSCRASLPTDRGAGSCPLHKIALSQRKATRHDLPPTCKRDVRFRMARVALLCSSLENHRCIRAKNAAQMLPCFENKHGIKGRTFFLDYNSSTAVQCIHRHTLSTVALLYNPSIDIL